MVWLKYASGRWRVARGSWAEDQEDPHWESGYWWESGDDYGYWYYVPGVPAGIPALTEEEREEEARAGRGGGKGKGKPKAKPKPKSAPPPRVVDSSGLDVVPESCARINMIAAAKVVKAQDGGVLRHPPPCWRRPQPRFPPTAAGAQQRWCRDW